MLFACPVLLSGNNLRFSALPWTRFFQRESVQRTWESRFPKPPQRWVRRLADCLSSWSTFLPKTPPSAWWCCCVPRGSFPKRVAGHKQRDTECRARSVCSWVTALLSAQLELEAQRPCQGLVQESSLAVQVLSSECSLFVQQILSLWNAFEVCLMGQVMQSLLISKVQRERPALKSPGNALVSVSSPAFWLLRFSGKAWKALKQLLLLTPYPAGQSLRSGISVDAKGQAGLPDALWALPGLATAQLLARATHDSQHLLKPREG